MSTRSETGHAKNVANFGVLILILKEFGIKYQPANQAITLDTLQNIETNAIEALSAIKKEQPVYTRAMSDRDIDMKNLDKLVRRAFNALKSCGSPQKTIEAAKVLFDKITGAKKAPVKPEESIPAAEGKEKTTKTISTSQLSIDMRLDNFDKFVNLLEQTPEYVPNENELKTERLNLLYVKLTEMNRAVNASFNKLSNLRAVRDHVLYEEKSGMIAAVSAVKLYLRSIFDMRSNEYKQVTSLKFSNSKK